MVVSTEIDCDRDDGDRKVDQILCVDCDRDDREVDSDREVDCDREGDREVDSESDRDVDRDRDIARDRVYIGHNSNPGGIPTYPSPL